MVLTLVPLQITLRNVPDSDEIEKLIRDRIDRLQAVHPQLMRCRVVVEAAGHQRHGREFVVRVELKVPTSEINVDRQHNQDARIAVRDAFDAARRQLEDCAQ